MATRKKTAARGMSGDLQRTVDRLPVPYVRARVRGHVEHDGLVPALRQHIHDMGPDESGTAGDQYTHTATLGRTGRTSRARARHVTLP